MLPKNKRVPRALFKAILEEKNFQNSPHFSLRYSKKLGETRFAVSVSKKVSKKAVVRNKIRRRAYESLKTFANKTSPGLYLVIAKNGADKTKRQELDTEIKELFLKGGLIVST